MVCAYIVRLQQSQVLLRLGPNSLETVGPTQPVEELVWPIEIILSIPLLHVGQVSVTD